MRQGFDATNDVDSVTGLPAGGHVQGTGLAIRWQNGPLGRGEDRQMPNGAFVEDVIEAARQRIEWYQEVCDGRFACDANAIALDALGRALHWLRRRTALREERGVEGTHEP